MSTPTNDVRALFNVLEGLSSPPANSPAGAWEGVLGCEFETLEFAKRYTEALGLYHGAMAQISALPDSARERSEKYAWTWWRAMTAPSVAWTQKVNFSDLMPEHALDQLGTLADLVESRMAGAGVSPSDEKLSELRATCEEWIEVVAGETELPEQLRAELLLNLRHVVWLVENAELFGLARVSAAGQTLLGEVATVSHRLTPAKRGMWKQWSLGLLRVLMVVGGVDAGIDTTMELGSTGTEMFGELVSGSEDGGAPTAPGPVELGPGPDGASENA